ncbi:hypothetical protein [Nocardioides sp. AE5]|uniref:hypothetical protein n=1 Tax=Nocardioides sp. AE5 TaxID=2962573 RepID=UPI0028824122|nr:hypothetical protein [Nocardioides sp. AE5]MDT0200841.1 hypothetical protein [Nocardioides sp. AE5]
MHVVAGITAVLGGACLLARHFIEDQAGADILKWSAAGLLALAVLVLGLRVVPRAPLWLQGIVSIGVVALLGSVWATLRSAIDTEAADLVVAVAAIGLGLAVAALGGRGDQSDQDGDAPAPAGPKRWGPASAVTDPEPPAPSGSGGTHAI